MDHDPRLVGRKERISDCDLKEKLVTDGVLVADAGQKLKFTKPWSFSSPSAAAAVILDRNSNVAWRGRLFGTQNGRSASAFSSKRLPHAATKIDCAFEANAPTVREEDRTDWSALKFRFSGISRFSLQSGECTLFARLNWVLGLFIQIGMVVRALYRIKMFK